MVVKSQYNLPLINSSKVALLCVDLQHMCCTPGYGGFSNISEDNWEDSEFSAYFQRIRDTVLPNVSYLQEIFREKGMEIIHIRIQALTKDGRDRSLEHKRLGSLAIPGSKEAEFLEEISPMEDEIIINKTASGAFNSTNIEYVLRNLNINQIIVVGCETSECVETTVRDAADRGFEVIVPEDATAALSDIIQDSSIEAMNYTYAHIIKTEDLCNVLKSLPSRQTRV